MTGLEQADRKRLLLSWPKTDDQRRGPIAVAAKV